MLLSPPPPPPGFAGEPSREPLPATGTDARIWLVRHGRVEVPGSAYGDEDVRLSDEGRRQAVAVADAVRGEDVCGVWSSPLQRALTMGEAVAAGTGTPLTVDRRLAEMHRGAWQGIPRTEYQERWRAEADRYWSATLDWAAPGAEPERALAERGAAALADVVRGAGGGVALVTAHRQVIRATVAALLGIPPGRSYAMTLDPGHAVLMVDTPGGWTLERTNVANISAPLAAQPAGGPPRDVLTREP